MFPVQLKPGIRYKLFDETYTILKKLPDLKVEAEEDKFKAVKIFTFTELVKHLSNGDLKFECTGKNLDFINEAINESYNKKQRITIRELWFCIITKISDFNKFSVKQLQIPPYSSIARYISDIPEYELVAKRIGNRTVENKFREIGNGLEANYPLERVEIDHTPIDVIPVDENGSSLGRPYLVLAIDKFSRQVLGFSIGISNGVGWPEVMKCIKHIMSDKSYVNEIYPFIENEWTAFGLPKTIVVDNGLEFKNNAMKDACYQLGFVLQFCPPKVPQWKGSIERFFGTANTNLFHQLPGTTRSNPTKLGDDENPTNLAWLTFSTFIAIVHKWIIDVYSQDLNKGAGGTPALIWKKSIEDYPISLPNNISETAILLGRTAYRKISRRGIELDTLHYNNIELNKLLLQFTQENKGKEEDFLIKYDPQNIYEVFVYDHLINKKWIKVHCTNADYSKNLSEWEHKEMRAYARKEFGIVDIESLARAKSHIRKMLEKGIGYTEKEIARAKKTTSETEINDKLQAKATRSTTNSTIMLRKSIPSKVTSDNVSDLGIVITYPDTVIPETLALKKETKNVKKVIKINSDSKKSQKDILERKVSESIQDSGSIFEVDDFAGFGIMSGISEVDFNE
jgi:putative transposase